MGQSQIARTSAAGRAAAAARAESSATLVGGAGLDSIGLKQFAAYSGACYDARSLDAINADAATRAELLIGREQLDHRRHSLDVAANAPLVAAKKLVKLLDLNMSDRELRDAMVVTVGNPTFAARPCRGHRAVPAKKLVQKFGARYPTLVMDENLTSQVILLFVFAYFVRYRKHQIKTEIFVYRNVLSAAVS